MKNSLVLTSSSSIIVDATKNLPSAKSLLDLALYPVLRDDNSLISHICVAKLTLTFDGKKICDVERKFHGSPTTMPDINLAAYALNTCSENFLNGKTCAEVRAAKPNADFFNYSDIEIKLEYSF